MSDIDLDALQEAWAVLDAAADDGPGPSHDALIAFSRAIDYLTVLKASTASIAASSLALVQRAEEAEKECAEQARLVGMGAERELSLMAKLGQAEKEWDAEKDRTHSLARYMGMLIAASGQPRDFKPSDLLGVIEALRKDAERYRWLRKGLPYRVEATEGKAIYLVSPRPESGYPDALDASLDAAMAQEGGK